MVAGKENQVEAPIPVKFVSAAADAGLAQTVPSALKGEDENSGRGACFFDYDADGKPDLFLAAGSAQGGAALYHNAGNGKFEEVTKAAGLESLKDVVTCAAADYDADGFVDLAIATTSGVRLFHNEHNGTFKNVTEAAGLKVPLKNVASLTWIDYDHDNDTDLYISSGDGASVLMRNNGNSTFSDVTAETGMGGDGPQFSAIGSDFNNDRAVDFVAAGKNAHVLLNPREGKFLPLEGAREALPLVISLQGRQPQVGTSGVGLCRLSPHLACLDFLSDLGENRQWTAGRHCLDAARALTLVLERVQPA